MNLLRLSAILMVCFAFAAVTVTAVADDKTDNKDKIVGTWQIAKKGGGAPSEGSIEFTKDGKLKISVTQQVRTKDGKNAPVTESIEGTYKVEGDKLTVVLKIGNKEKKETMTIKTLTDKNLVTVDARGKEDEFKKK